MLIYSSSSVRFFLGQFFFAVCKTDSNFCFLFVGVVICVCILICNFSVSKILYKSYHQMQITLSSLEISQSVKKVGSLKHRISDYNSSTPTRSSFVTRDEVRFAKLMILLSITFVLCWGCQMVRVLANNLIRMF